MKNLTNRNFRKIASIAVLIGLFVCDDIRAQCPVDWVKTDGFPGAGGIPNVNAITTWDPDGAGPQASRLVAGGGFDYMTDIAADKIAVLNPETGRWEDLDGGIDYISVDKKTGEPVDGGSVLSLCVYQDDLIVGGVISQVGDAPAIPANFIARWDGSSWSALGSGLNGWVNSMTVFNGELVATGSFITTGPPGGGTVVNRIARWNGTTWLPLGTGINGDVNNVIVYNGELIAVGSFTSAGGVAAKNIARWNGSQWKTLEPIGLNASAFGLAVLGDDLYVSGNFTLAGGVPQTRGVARWDGAAGGAWHPVGGGTLFAVRTLIAYNGDIIAGGAFILPLDGQEVRGLARFHTESQQWHVMEGGFDPSGGASQFAIHNFGGVGSPQDELVVAGSFYKVGNRTAMGIARWSEAAQAWDRFAPGFDWNPWRFTTYRGDLIAGGSFYSAGNVEARGVARFDGAEWHALGTGVGNPAGNVVGAIDVFAVYKDELYVGGHFHSAGGVPALHIAKWNGDTETWSDVGGGVNGYAVPRVFAMVEYKGDLIVGGNFLTAGGVSADSVARWDGKQWHAMPGFVGTISSMAVFNGEVYVSVTAGLVGMQRWNGTQWHAVPGGYNNFSMTVFDGKLISGFNQPFAYDGNTWTPLPGWSVAGAGAAIYAYVVFQGELIVGGGFGDAAGIPEADGLVRFDGTSWHSLATGNGTPVSASGMWVHNGQLITNGHLNHPDGTFSHWRRWQSVCPFGDITQNGTIDVDDLLAVINAWGPCTDCAADVTGNGIVDVDDLLIIINNWG